MKQSFLFLLLLAVTVFTSQAKSYEIYVGGVQVTDENKNAIQEGVSFALDENQSSCGILYLNNAHIVADGIDGCAIQFMGTTEMRELDIHITGSCSLTAQRGYGMYLYTAEDESAYVFIMPQSDEARLTINASKNAIFMQEDAELNFGFGLPQTLIVNSTSGAEAIKATSDDTYLSILQNANLYFTAGTSDNPQKIFHGVGNINMYGTPAIEPKSSWDSVNEEFYLYNTQQPVTGYLEIVNVAGTGIEDIVANDSNRSHAKKVMLDGTLYIVMPDGSACNMQGQHVR